MKKYIKLVVALFAVTLQLNAITLYPALWVDFAHGGVDMACGASYIMTEMEKMTANEESGGYISAGYNLEIDDTYTQNVGYGFAEFYISVNSVNAPDYLGHVDDAPPSSPHLWVVGYVELTFWTSLDTQSVRQNYSLY